MGRPRNELIDWLQYMGLRLVSCALHCFPVEVNLGTARLLGDMIYRFDRRHRERAMANLKRSFPGISQREMEIVARQSMQELFMLGIEVMFTTRLVRLDTFRRYVDLQNFKPVLELLLGRERGVILLTAHYGNFEILGYVLATMGFPTASVARPLDNRFVSQWVFGVREKHGQQIIAKKGATEEVTAVLERNGAVAFVADQNAGSKGLFVDFFGRKASTYKSIGLLAMTYRVPVVIGYARRVNDRFRFRVAAQDIIYPADWENESNPLHYITQRYTKAIEDFVREEPGQYWWVHRRWKSRPKGEVAEAYD